MKIHEFIMTLNTEKAWQACLSPFEAAIKPTPYFENWYLKGKKLSMYMVFSGGTVFKGSPNWWGKTVGKIRQLSDVILNNLYQWFISQ